MKKILSSLINYKYTMYSFLMLITYPNVRPIMEFSNLMFKILEILKSFIFERSIDWTS